MIVCHNFFNSFITALLSGLTSGGGIGDLISAGGYYIDIKDADGETDLEKCESLGGTWYTDLVKKLPLLIEKI